MKKLEEGLYGIDSDAEPEKALVKLISVKADEGMGGFWVQDDESKKGWWTNAVLQVKDGAVHVLTEDDDVQ